MRFEDGLPVAEFVAEVFVVRVVEPNGFAEKVLFESVFGWNGVE